MLLCRKTSEAAIRSCQHFNSAAHRCNNSKRLKVQGMLRAVLIDLSGTIHIDDSEIPGSIKALERLNKERLHIKFVTNTTKESRRILHERLTKIGFCISPDKIFTSLSSAHSLIVKRGLSPFMLLDDRAFEEFKDVPQASFDSVLVGLAPVKFNYENMNKAFRLVLDGCPLIAIHKARYYKRPDGLALGPGSFVTGLEYATGVKAEVVGKPEKSFFFSAVQELDVKPEECVMIGDDVRDDICGAVSAGMKGILVKTGKYRPGDETQLPEDASVVDDFSSAVDLILNTLSNGLSR